MRIRPMLSIVVAVLLLMSSAFSVHAFAQGVIASDHPVDVPTLCWVDAQSGTTLFSIADIVRFDWDRQLFELTPERASALLALPIAPFRDFIVKDADGIIYRGRIYRSTAREGYDGSTILIDQGAKQALPAPPFFTISGGYPGGGGPHDQERFTPRLRTILDRAGVLAPIAESELPHALKWMGNSWIGGDQVLCATPGIFPSTVRVGKTAYLHIKFAKGNHPEVKFDRLDMLVTCATKEGKFSVTQPLAGITTPPVSNDLRVCSFVPWKAMVAPPPPDNMNAPPAIKGRARPMYSKSAMEFNRGGTFIAALAIDADGKAGNITIVQSTGFTDLDKSALHALHKCTFTPAIKDGHPDAGSINVQYVFADGQVAQTILPPDPIAVTAKPGRMTLTVTFNTLQKTADGYTQTGSWTLPPYEVMLLPAEPAPVAPVPAAKPAQESVK